MSALDGRGNLCRECRERECRPADVLADLAAVSLRNAADALSRGKLDLALSTLASGLAYQISEANGVCGQCVPLRPRAATVEQLRHLAGFLRDLANRGVLERAMPAGEPRLAETAEHASREDDHAPKGDPSQATPSVGIREVRIVCHCGAAMTVRLGARHDGASACACGQRWHARAHPVQLLASDPAAGAELVCIVPAGVTQ